ncbi:hypothetical protein B0T25DRAFT_89151 [Lasiosphaeria hispida]|uniref:Uncharacterized protein n=1 Tax=Lasiosphaeria hispida TaxID=260671 RepID=A0AAJ0MHP4_9PEZI|nr:hypothetical protein B0T25DRAFT_89151 [Lasiosphaeria hispida]
MAGVLWSLDWGFSHVSRVSLLGVAIVFSTHLAYAQDRPKPRSLHYQKSLIRIFVSVYNKPRSMARGDAESGPWEHDTVVDRRGWHRTLDVCA